MNVLIFGGSGYLGAHLIKSFLSAGFHVHVVTRNRTKTSKQFGETVNLIEWNYTDLFKKIIHDEIDVVINLAGYALAQKWWTRKVKRRILGSRILTTRGIVEAINKEFITPKIFICASAVGYYGNKGDQTVTENSESGGGFLSNVCQQWEQEAEKIEGSEIRTVILRTSVVLGENGILKTLALPFRFFLGGTLGTGYQWMSWIHIIDFIRAVEYVIANPNISGPVNLASPNPVMNRQFSKNIGKILHKPVVFRIPKIFLKIFLGEKSQMILDSQRVVPEKLISAGFQFKYPDLLLALNSILLK